MVVGRCAETKLKGFPGLISFFILGDKEKKAERVMKVYGVSRDEALHMMEREDWERKPIIITIAGENGEIPGIMISPSTAAGWVLTAR